MSDLHLQLQEELKEAKAQFEEYLEDGIPDDPEFDKDVLATIHSLYEISQKLSDLGTVTPKSAQRIVEALKFAKKMSDAIGDSDSAQNISFLIIELDEFIERDSAQKDKPTYLRGLDF